MLFRSSAQISKIREEANQFIITELKEHGVEGLVPSHGDIFYHLFFEERCTMNDLAEKIHRTRPTVTILVNKLEACGYVERAKSETDGRVTYVTLTDSGRTLEPAFREISEKLNTIVYGDLSDEDATFFEELLTSRYARFTQGIGEEAYNN